ncbi:hypothetical protein FRB99_007549, partial [Tulasnella sp. 403]
MDQHLTPPMSRPISSLSIRQASEEQPLLAGDEEQGRHYVEPAASAPPSPPLFENKPHNRWDTFKIRVRYYIPSTSWVPNYSFNSFWGDAAAGVTVASVLIPQSMSYATGLAKLNPTVGLLAAA